VRELRATEEFQDERMRADRGGAADPAGMTPEALQEFVIQGLQAAIERGDVALEDLSTIELDDSAVEDIT
jgi:hypothetical protein